VATGQLTPVLRFLQRLAVAPPLRALDDGQLLTHFVVGDPAAFAALVQRHGPMVLGVCRRVVADGDAAEDAFQLTFLVLARKARSIRQPERLAAFLHGVAYRIAAKLRADAARRRRRERQAARPDALDPADDLVWRDLWPILDEAVNGLPERYRLPVVLCYLEGKTNSEAGALLGCSRDTVATRLSRARQLLRGRLARRGLGLSAAALVTALADRARAAVPAPVLRDTVEAAVKAVDCVGTGVAAVVRKGVKQIMAGMQNKRAGLLLVVALVGAGAVAWLSAGRPAAGRQPEAKQAPGKRQTQAAGQAPAPVPDAERLVAFLNDNARRITTLECQQLTLEVRRREKVVSWQGQFVCQLPDRLRFRASLLGKPVVDLGCNGQEWGLLYASGEDGPVTFHGDRRGSQVFREMVAMLGLTPLDPGRPREVVARGDTLELREPPAVGEEEPVTKIHLFNRHVDPIQFRGFRLEDQHGTVLGWGTITRVHLDKPSGAVIPVRLKLEAPGFLSVRAHLEEIRVNAPVEPDRARRLFSIPRTLSGSVPDESPLRGAR
jgi:RNA polymerase sigma factor (sigma-70 family)